MKKKRSGLNKGLIGYVGLFMLVLTVTFGVTYLLIWSLTVEHRSERIISFKLGETDQLKQGDDADKISNFLLNHNFTTISSSKRKTSDEFIIRYGKSDGEKSALSYVDVVKRDGRYLFFREGYETSSIELDKSEMKEFKRLMCVGINDCYF